MGDIGIISLTVLAYMTFIFIISRIIKRLDMVDIAWGGVFIVIALTSLFLGNRGTLQYLVSGIVVIWGLRLSFYIFKRFKRSKDEDPRYAEMQNSWRGSIYVNAYFRIFIIQGLLALLISASVIVINLSGDTDIEPTALIGLVVWIAGFLFESIGDSQLRAHLEDPKNKGKLMTSGLWRYTRHPNYFGEAVQWWGILIIALSVPYGWVSVIGPFVITVLLLFVSGVPLTENRFEGRPGWDAYKKRTSVFIPLPPRK